MVIITLLAVITVVQIAISLIASCTDDCDRYEFKRKADIISKLSKLILLLLGILWGLIIMK